VIVNNNTQCTLKKGKFFMDEKDRVEIVNNLKSVDEVFLSIDKDKTVCKSLEELYSIYFANGGDRGKGNVPEVEVCKDVGVEMLWGVGGGKVQSSSDLIKKAEKKND
jgi:glycerol-3-phosphate cytidylyltransferase-like family protein